MKRFPKKDRSDSLPDGERPQKGPPPDPHRLAIIRTSRKRIRRAWQEVAAQLNLEWPLLSALIASLADTLVGANESISVRALNHMVSTTRWALKEGRIIGKKSKVLAIQTMRASITSSAPKGAPNTPYPPPTSSLPPATSSDGTNTDSQRYFSVHPDQIYMEQLSEDEEATRGLVAGRGEALRLAHETRLRGTSEGGAGGTKPEAVGPVKAPVRLVRFEVMQPHFIWMHEPTMLRPEELVYERFPSKVQRDRAHLEFVAHAKGLNPRDNSVENTRRLREGAKQLMLARKRSIVFPPVALWTVEVSGLHIPFAGFGVGCRIRHKPSGYVLEREARETFERNRFMAELILDVRLRLLAGKMVKLKDIEWADKRMMEGGKPFFVDTLPEDLQEKIAEVRGIRERRASRTYKGLYVARDVVLGSANGQQNEPESEPTESAQPRDPRDAEADALPEDRAGDDCGSECPACADLSSPD